jgi:hypothetical protein
MLRLSEDLYPLAYSFFFPTPIEPGVLLPDPLLSTWFLECSGLPPLSRLPCNYNPVRVWGLNRPLCCFCSGSTGLRSALP